MPRRGRFLLHTLGYFSEVAGIAEILVDAGEANVGDMVERLEPGHHGFPDARRRDLVALGFQLPLHPAHQPVDLGRVDVALARRMADRAFELGPFERLALAVFLDDREVAQLDTLKGGEPRAACLALAPPPDRSAVFARPAVFDLAVFMRAQRTAHSLALINGKAGAELANAFVHSLLHRAVVFEAIGPQPIQDVGDHFRNFAKFDHAEAAGGRSRGADTNAAGLDRRQRVEGNAILVAGDPG